ncbi:hypothetical protein [Actinosynnema sp. NPDC023587]|uniref:hypothetical protein n=1 Tax=Actinosynnema sp. NPDC023587 TaxID=3154695 RepID=UPI0033C20CF1
MTTTPPPDETEAARLFDTLTEEERHTQLAAAYGVHCDAFKAMSLVDFTIANIIGGAIQELRRLELLHRDEPAIEQTITGLARLNPIYIFDAIHQETTALLDPPTER